VKEATGAIKAGYSQRMMLEVAPERSFGVLSPSFYGCEGTVALNQFASNGCNFLKNNLCELYATGCQPLECRFCHHDRVGLGPVCHASLEKDWFTPAGRALIAHWCRITGIWDMLSLYGLDRLRKTG